MTIACHVDDRWRPLVATAWAVCLLVGLSAAVQAQQRPLLTQDPESIGAGRVLVEGGFDYGTDMFFPVSGLQGNLLRVPLIGVVVGVSEIAELQFTGGPYRALSISSRQPAAIAPDLDADATSTSAVEDLVIGAKVRVAKETAARPGVAFHFATRLPNASRASGLGLDTTDFHAGLAFGKTAKTVRVVGNVGLGILPKPVEGQGQNDVLTYGISVAKAITAGFDVVGELNGRANLRSGEAPLGTESRGQLRAGVRYTRGAGRLDAAAIVGTTSRDPGLGFTVGFTYVFQAFTVH